MGLNEAAGFLGHYSVGGIWEVGCCWVNPEK